MKHIIALLLLLASLTAQAADPTAFSVTWDPVVDSRVTFYDLAWGAATGARTTHAKVDKALTTAQVPVTGWPVYYVAIRACASDTFCSGWSNEVAVPWIPIPGNFKVIITWQVN